MPYSQIPRIRQTVSFRDPVGRVVLLDDRCFRLMTAPAGSVLQEFLATDVAQHAMQQGKLIRTIECDSTPDEVLDIVESVDWVPEFPPRVFEHDTVSFFNYPHEWCAEMFESAARLTLDLAKATLPLGFNLKDGSPWNIMFRGSEPVFLDMASFERRIPLERVWLPYGQFLRTFLLPLLLWRTMHTPPGYHFRWARDGLRPLDCYRQLGFGRAVFPPALEVCAVPAGFAWWAARRGKTTAQVKPRSARSPEEAEYVVSHLLRRLERSLDRIVAKTPVRSEWTGYNNEVAEREFATGYQDAKTKFISEALELTQPSLCLDIGCNTGHYSLLAAAIGARVVAVDNDAACLGDLYRRARADQRDILPLVIDIGRPTPALGWNNSESAAFLDRAVAARFELVMMLALIHHLCLIERVPLHEVARLAARLTQRWLVIEFVPREDPLAQLMPGFWTGDSDWSYYNQDAFTAAFGRYFRILRAEELAASGRWIYLMEHQHGESA